jgi:pyruvate formate lyase activating enzyme
MVDPPDTTAEGLLRAAEIGKQSGLRYIYPGNLPGRVGDLENTRCAKCGETLIERYGYRIRGYYLTGEGACPTCGTKLPGRFSSGFDGQIASHPFLPNQKRTHFPIVN